MRDDFFQQICHLYHLGNLQSKPQITPGGLTHSLNKVTTDKGSFAIKIIDKNDPRSRQFFDYQSTEALAYYFKNKNVNTVVSKGLTPKNDTIVMVFPWCEARQLYGPLGPTTEQHAAWAGEMLAQIHSVAPVTGFTLTRVDYLAQEAQLNEHIKQYELLTPELLKACHDAYQASKQSEILSHGDFSPHNILYDHEKSYLIDWDLAGPICPHLEFVLALITFSGATTPTFSQPAFEIFIRAYRRQRDIEHIDFEQALYAVITKGWLDWLYYNMRCLAKAATVAIHQKHINAAYASLKLLLTNKMRLVKLYENELQRQL